MKREIVAFVSLGFGCGGPEMGDYVTFDVELTEEESKCVEKIASDSSITGYKRSALAKLYPDIDKKIRKAGQELVERISLLDIIRNSINYLDVDLLVKEDIDSGAFKHEGIINNDDQQLTNKWYSWEISRIMQMESKTRFDFVKDRYGIDNDVALEDICGKLCYYLCREEIPGDYKG